MSIDVKFWRFLRNIKTKAKLKEKIFDYGTFELPPIKACGFLIHRTMPYPFGIESNMISKGLTSRSPYGTVCETRLSFHIYIELIITNKGCES